MSRREKILRAADVLTFVFLCFLFIVGARRLFIESGPLTLGVLLVAAVALYLVVDYVTLQVRRWQHARGRHKCEHERALQEALYLLECYVDLDLDQCRVDLFGECSVHSARNAFGDCAHPEAVTLLARYPLEAPPDVQPQHAERPAPGRPGGEGAETPARGAGQAAGAAAAVVSKVVRWSGTLGMVGRVSADRRVLARPDLFLQYRETPLPMTVRGRDGMSAVCGTILGLGLVNDRIVAHGALRVDRLSEHAPGLLASLRRGEFAAVGLEVMAENGNYTYGDEGLLTMHDWTVRGAMLGVPAAAWPEAVIALDAEAVQS